MLSSSEDLTKSVRLDSIDGFIFGELTIHSASLHVGQLTCHCAPKTTKIERNNEKKRRRREI